MKITFRNVAAFFIILHVIGIVCVAAAMLLGSANIGDMERSELEFTVPQKSCGLGNETIHYPALSIVKDGKVKPVSFLSHPQNLVVYETWRQKLDFLGSFNCIGKTPDATIWTPHLIVAFSPTATVFTPTAAPGKTFASYSRAPTVEDREIRRLMLEIGSASQQ